MCLQYKYILKMWEKDTLLLPAISPSPTVFSTFLENFLPFSSNLKLLSADFSSLEEFKFFSFGGEQCFVNMDPGE